MLFFFLNETDVAAAFQTGDSDGRNIFGPGIEAQIFFEVMFGDEGASHLGEIDFAVEHERDGPAFDELAEGVGFASAESAPAMDEHQDDASGDGWRKRGRCR
jgi:hypothetical protein